MSPPIQRPGAHRRDLTAYSSRWPHPLPRAQWGHHLHLLRDELGQSGTRPPARSRPPPAPGPRSRHDSWGGLAGGEEKGEPEEPGPAYRLPVVPRTVALLLSPGAAMLGTTTPRGRAAKWGRDNGKQGVSTSPQRGWAIALTVEGTVVNRPENEMLLKEDR